MFYLLSFERMVSLATKDTPIDLQQTLTELGALLPLLCVCPPLCVCRAEDLVLQQETSYKLDKKLDEISSWHNSPEISAVLSHSTRKNIHDAICAFKKVLGTEQVGS